MKVMFTADLHIKIGQKSVPRDWARNRYKILFSELVRVKSEYSVDCEVHGGDIFDKLPNLEELGIYLGYLAGQENPIYIFDGNHEATKKGHTFLSLLEGVLASINSDISLITDYHFATDEFPFDVIPYCRLKHFEKNPRTFGSEAYCLMTHVRGEIPPHVTPEVDLDIFKNWDVVFAGDLHSRSNAQRNIVYPGSPCTTSFHREEVSNGVFIIDTDTWSWEWVEIKVPQLIRKTVETEEEIVRTHPHHTIYELKGDAVDLAKVSKDIDLLDKKLIKHDSKSTLQLKGMTGRQELELYLREIVKLDENKLEKALRFYDDYIKKT
ncbi:MAG: hypothetical protein GY810_28425 [Aureispira sp.]|nr:hypothetical protein [Aureispira sp.]